MKKIIIVHKRISLPVAVLMLCILALSLYGTHATARFEASYRSYENVAAVQQNAAFLPGTSANPLRTQLNQTLAQVLSKDINAQERLRLANAGLDVVDELNKQVDAIGDSAQAVSDAIVQMNDAAQSPGTVLSRSVMLDLVDSAKQQMATIEDIRGLSYRANFETAEIFRRIITDKGQLTDTYIIELNNQVQVFEDEFNTRENSYTALQGMIYRMQQKFTMLAGGA